MRLLDASCHEYALTIEDQEIVAQKLSLGDLEGISQALAQEQREACDAEYLLVETFGDADRQAKLKQDVREKRNAVEAMTPGQLLPWLLVTARGQMLTLWTAIHHRHPEIGMDRIAGLTWTDELVQVVYDLLEVKRRPPTNPTNPTNDLSVKEGEQSPDPQPAGQSGGLSLPTPPTFTPALTGDDAPTGS